MIDFISHAGRRYGRSVAGRCLGFVLLIAAGLGSPPSYADPGDFAAMPGLWKIVTTPVEHGHRGKSVTEWICVDEGADPWVAFTKFSLPALARCQRSEKRRVSTALDWTENCGGNPPELGHGHAGFDSAEHYTASIMLQNRGEILQVEGQRQAACTGPSD